MTALMAGIEKGIKKAMGGKKSGGGKKGKSSGGSAEKKAVNKAKGMLK